MQAAIELMDMMDKSGGSLTLYNKIFDWHLKHLAADEKVTSKRLYRDLLSRYNLKPVLPYEVPTQLPHEGTKVKLACHDALYQTYDLLSDPRIKDSDYLFYNNDPTAPPPEEFTMLGDINTGRAYRQSYKVLIEPNPITPCGRFKILVPYIFYLDGCVTGQFQNNQLELMKFTLGIFNRQCREKNWAWRNLGSIRRVLKRSNDAKNMIKRSSHIDSKKILKDDRYHRRGAIQMTANPGGFDSTLYDTDTDDSTNENYTPRDQLPRKKPPKVKSQDFMCMMQTLLSSYKKKIQDPGGYP